MIGRQSNPVQIYVPQGGLSKCEYWRSSLIAKGDNPRILQLIGTSSSHQVMMDYFATAPLFSTVYVPATVTASASHTTRNNQTRCVFGVALQTICCEMVTAVRPLSCWYCRLNKMLIVSVVESDAYASWGSLTTRTCFVV